MLPGSLHTPSHPCHVGPALGCTAPRGHWLPRATQWGSGLSGESTAALADCSVLLSLSVCLLHPRGRGPGPRTQDPSSLSPEPGVLRGSQETVQGPGDKVTPRTGGTGCRQVMDCGLSHCMLGKELQWGGQGTEDIAEWARQLVRACATPPGGHGHLDSLVCRHPLFI